MVEGVTRKDGKLSGSVNDLSLAMGQIHAKVDLVGTETAEYLLQHGCEVAIVEMLDKIAAGESETILPLMLPPRLAAMFNYSSLAA